MAISQTIVEGDRIYLRYIKDNEYIGINLDPGVVDKLRKI